MMRNKPLSCKKCEQKSYCDGAICYPNPVLQSVKEVRKTNKITTYKGNPIESLTREELIIALNEMDKYYKSRLENKDKIINILDEVIGVK